VLWIQLLFWATAATLAYTFAGYPLLLRLLARWFPRPARSQAARPPFSISVVMAARNEAPRIAARVQNLLDCERVGALEIIVVCDGPQADINETLRSWEAPTVRVLSLSQPAGKAACLNLGVSAAAHDLIAFADARQRFHPRALVELVSPFADAEVGAVSGSLEIDPARAGIGQGIDCYWRLEKALRLDESRYDSAIGCTGAIYAIRRSLFRPIPDDTILDDVEIPMRILAQGYRVLFAPGAIAWDTQSLEPRLERRRKRRTLAGNFQLLFRHAEWLTPAGNRAWWQLISHKYHRLTGPYCLTALFMATVQHRQLPLYRVALWGQFAFYGLAVLGLSRLSRHRLCSISAGFVFLNWMVLEGLWTFRFGSQRRGWAEPLLSAHRSPSPHSS
jgi:cellulose synthase/poly-beta-1,6-N-acetylglucosamine synthase-like glycosyltransferase